MGGRRWRERVAAALAVVVVTMGVSVGTAAAAPVATPIKASAAHVVGGPAVDAHSAGLIPAGTHCSRTSATVRRGTRRDVVESCVTIQAASAAKINKLRPEAQAANSGIDSTWCFTMTDDVWWITRASACALFVLTFQDLNSSTGAVLGTAEFLESEELDFSATSTSWREFDALYVASQTGDEIGAPVTLQVACLAPCLPSVTVIFNSVPVVEGQTLTAVSNYSDTLGSTAVTDTMHNVYDFVSLPIGSTVINPATWTSPNMRCDNEVGGNSGCVVPDFEPTLNLSIQRSGAGAAFVGWAQNNLSAHWGLLGKGQPLKRLANGGTGNRRIICQDGSFTADPNIYQDTCDEFPFAATYESGALNGVTTGASCAQATAVASPSAPPADTLPPLLPEKTVVQYYPGFKLLATPTGTEACLRSHTPQQLNSDVGGQLGNFTTGERLLDNDEYWVSVTQSPVVVVGN